MVSLRTLLASFCNRMFSCFSFADELPVAEELPVVDELPVAEELPVVDELPVADELPVVDELPVAEELPVADELPVDDQQLHSSDSYSASKESVISEILSNFSLDDHLDSSCFSELPDSLIHEILVKLPVKTILQCRIVCKSWNKLISHPYFTKFCFKNFTYIAFSQHKDIITCPDDESFGLVEIGNKGDVRRKPMNMNTWDSPVPGITNTEKSWSLVGSCDGLLCLVAIPYEESYYLYNCVTERLRGPNQVVWIINPLIGKYMKLPKAHGDDHDIVLYGFGSTVDGNHYKVLKIAKRNYGCVVGAEILTIGVDEKWRDLDISTFPAGIYSHGVTLNGILHWIGYNDWGRHVVYAFDIGKETGQSFPIPFEDVFLLRCYLVVWDGHLCILNNINDFQVDLWTMKRYGVVESWTRDIIILNNSFAYFCRLIPITTMRNGDLLLLCQFCQSLMSFDQKTKEFVELEVYKLHDFCSTTFAYTPSFVSLRSMMPR